MVLFIKIIPYNFPTYIILLVTVANSSLKECCTAGVKRILKIEYPNVYNVMEYVSNCICSDEVNLKKEQIID